jgi:ferrous iron transport protein A
VNIVSLGKLEPQERGRIIRVGGGGEIRHRLLDMGVVSGAIVEVLRVAPLGDPVEIKVKGYELALRRQEADRIQVEVVGGPLSRATNGQVVTVSAVRAGWGLERRLADLGITKGVEMKVISAGRPGQVVVQVRGSRLALGRGVADKIIISNAGETDGS